MSSDVRSVLCLKKLQIALLQLQLQLSFQFIMDSDDILEHFCNKQAISLTACAICVLNYIILVHCSLMVGLLRLVHTVIIGLARCPPA